MNTYDEGCRISSIGYLRDTYDHPGTCSLPILIIQVNDLVADTGLVIFPEQDIKLLHDLQSKTCGIRCISFRCFPSNAIIFNGDHLQLILLVNGDPQRSLPFLCLSPCLMAFSTKIWISILGISLFCRHSQICEFRTLTDL